MDKSCLSETRTETLGCLKAGKCSKMPKDLEYETIFPFQVLKQSEQLHYCIQQSEYQKEKTASE